ncbi:triacylglycerol lipase [Corynebacterium callunae]|uniref:esterase/lipase family protein n=1 Tax=Corynebacterium callunae TaxID=1721 RepID=UPI003981D854
MVEAFSDLRRELTNALRAVWKNLPTDDAPQADSLSEDVVREIVSNYYRDHKNRSKLNEDTTGSLPVLARLKPRGLFEDDWRARPTADRPWPVVLVHGTGTTKGDWQELGAELRKDGWAVFAPDFGQRATGPVPESAAQIGAYIDTVLLATGASQVVLVGHSQGGVLLRYWMRVLGNADKVKHMVCLAVPNHGTTMGGIISPLLRSNRGESVANSVVQSWFGSAGFEMIRDNEIIKAINEGGDLDPGVSYLCIATHFDTVIQPPETCFLQPDSPEDASRIRNIWVENLDPNSVVLHENMPYDSRVRALVRADLARLCKAETPTETPAEN